MKTYQIYIKNTVALTKEKGQMAYKPGSVQWLPTCKIIHLALLLPTTSCNQPERHSEREAAEASRSYSILHPVGFTMPFLSPERRCALTAPFHPYQSKLAVYFLWHFP